MGEHSETIERLTESYRSGALSEDEYVDAIESLGEDDEDEEGDDSPEEYTPRQLREMTDAEAESLPADQQQRREKILELYHDAEETKEQWTEEDREVGNIVIHANPEALGTSVELYGNDLLVQLDTDDEDLRQAAQSLEAVEDMSKEEFRDLGGEAYEEAIAAAGQMLDALLVKWNGTAWDRLPSERRSAILDDAREAWGAVKFVQATFETMAAVQQDMDEMTEAVDSFRGAEGGERGGDS
jgi:hypothetical protein